MPIIASYINLFSVNQPIYYLPDGQTPMLVAQVPIDMVSTTLISLCKKYNLEEVHVHGQEQYITSIVNFISEQSDIKVIKNK